MVKLAAGASVPTSSVEFSMSFFCSARMSLSSSWSWMASSAVAAKKDGGYTDDGHDGQGIRLGARGGRKKHEA
jgi:hypothetical protein